MHPVIVVLLWLVTCCVADIEITYQNGVHLKLNGWPNALARRYRKFKLDRQLKRMRR